MSIPQGVSVPALEYVPMSFEDWWALPQPPKAEWVDGVAVVSPPASFDHAGAQRRLANALDAALAPLRATHEVAVRLPGNRIRVPDVMVLERRPDGVIVTDVPVLVVEILSPSTRAEDLLRKGPDYARAGIGQYWVVDPEGRTLEVSVNSEGSWTPVLRLDDSHPTGEVTVGEHRAVRLDLRDILEG